ncbi:hypothetical protein ACFYZE_20795 [Streptomyces sp. NPDC001796]|uniref:hypothetical protein n=1 Tax=Streptomyces sp. NPDC001796 TaxID=3364609 RepID=UPI0036C9C1F3
MTSTQHPTSVARREATDSNGRVYRNGASDAGLPERQDSPAAMRSFGIALKALLRTHRCGRRARRVTATAVPARFLKTPGRPSVRRIVPNQHPLGEEMA